MCIRDRGKSTTIKTVIGALGLRGGEIRFGGQSLARLRPDAIARLGVAIVPEGRQCFPNLTVQEHLVAFADQRNDQRDSWTLERIYGVFPRLKERARNMGNQLSGGEQQMLAIGRALSTNPRLLILDEAPRAWRPSSAKKSGAAWPRCVPPDRPSWWSTSMCTGSWAWRIAMSSWSGAGWCGRAVRQSSMPTAACGPATWASEPPAATMQRTDRMPFA